MKNNDHNKASADNLRRKAEEQIKKEPKSPDQSLPEGDALKLVHELQVHQIELEMQNEELMEAQKQAEDAINLYDSAPTGFFTLSKDGTIIRLNLSGAGKLHKDRESLKGSKFGFFVSDETKGIFNTFLQNIFNNKSKETCEICLYTSGYTPINVILTGISGKEEDQCYITSVNISRLKEFEITLQNERELYQDIVNNQPAGIYRIRVFQKGNWWNKSWGSSANPPYRMELANDRFCEILGITREIFETNPAIIVDLIHPEDKQEFIIKNEEANTKRIPFKWNGRLVIGGAIRWIHLESIPHEMPDGEIIWTGILYDTTDQELKEEELKESENKYRDLVENSPDAISIYSEGKVVFVNNECLRLLAAKSADELLGKSVVDFIHPDSRLLIFERMQDVAKEHNIQPLTKEKFLRLDGTTVDVEVKSMPIMFQNKQAVQLIVRDITESRKAENELSKSQKEFKDLFDNAPVGYHEIDIEGRIVRINQTELNLLGYSLDELIGQFVSKISANELASGIAAREKLEGKNIPVKSFERNFRRKDNSTFPVLVQDKILYNDQGTITGIRSTIQDITELKKTENDLNNSREDFKNLFDNAPVGYHEIDSEGRILRMNQTELTMLGYAEEELIGKYIWEIAHNEVETHQQVIDKLSGHNIPTSAFETILINKTGQTYSILIQDKLQYDKYGKITGIRTTIQDITERKLAELNLQLSEEKFRNSFENSTIGKSLISLDDKLSVNKAFCQIVGYSEDELSNLKWTEFTHKDDIEFNLKQHHLILSGEKESSQWEKRYIHKNGNIVWVDISTFLVRDSKGNPLGFITEIYDITERKKAEAELLENRSLLHKLLFISSEFINSSSKGIDYTKMTDTICEISGAKYGSFNLLDEKGHEYTTVGVSGLSEMVLKAQTILGFKLVNKKWKPDAIKEDKIKNNIISKFDSISDLAKNMLPKAIISLIEKTFNIREACVVKISKKDRIIGDFTLNFTKGKTLQNPEIVEFFADQVGLFIEREKTDKELRINEEKYRYLFANNPQPMYIYDVETLAFLEVNLAAIKHYGYSKEEFLQMTIKDIRPSEDIPTLLTEVKDKRDIYKPTGEWRHIKKNGEIIFVDITTVSVISNSRRVRHVMIQDITERKHAEDALKESVSLLNATIESTADGILVVDREGKVSIFNQRFVDMWKIPMYILDKRDDVPLIDTIKKQVKKQEELLNKVQYLYNNPKESSNDQIELIDGRVFDRYSLPHRIGDKIVGRAWSFRDITLSKKAEEALRVNELKFRSITEQIDDLITISDEKGIINYASTASKSLFQYENEEMIGHSFMEFIHEESLPVAIAAFNSGVNELKKAVDIELKLKRKDGSVFIGEINGTQYINGDQKSILVVVHDITNRRLTEEALRMSEDKYRTMIEYSNDLIWSLDRDGNFTFMNKVATKTTGLVSKDWIGKSFIDLIFPEDLPMLMDVFQRTLAGESCFYELRFKKADESILTISVNTSPIYSKGNIEGIVSFGRDITAEKLALQSLSESEELYRNLVLRIPDGVYKSTTDGKFIDVNPAMVQMLGYESKEEILEIDIKKQLYFDSSDRESLVLQEKHEETAVFQLKKKDGSGIWIEDHGWYVVDDNQNILYHEGVLRDITERKHAEEELEEKMNELIRFQNLTVDRELAMIELKKEINELLINSGRKEKYRIVK